ncbi:nucleoporin NUP35 isoform X2 [Epinephelus lanceolatus]|uniref:nucleoporin NUP35 isoform X2 n=1 Tax=Epinephelus lanceolatus TaxID=310571 RepID=UPI001446A6E3|nr:nucleoporin NUP35 isoform X2 [Epinephelus lanceolatus]XP_049904404.1 nucleoporin NUP35 isoform X2 [Epinephelus moara]
MDLQVGTEPMTLGSPTSPKPTPGAQFLPGFLMGDLPAPASPQPRPFSLTSPIIESTGGGGSAPQPVVPTPKDKSGAPPVRSIHDDLINVATPLNTHRQSFPVMHSPLSARGASTPGVQQLCLSPAQVDPFYSQGETLSSDDQLDQTWVTVFGFPPASASYILLQFAQYGNILKHTMASPGNWMHLQYQSRLQARKALSKDGKVFGDAIMVGVKPCIDKSVMDSCAAVSSPLSTSFSSSVLPSTPRSAIRPLSAAYRNSGSDYQVVADRQTPRKDDSFVSKAMEYMFGW